MDCNEVCTRETWGVKYRPGESGGLAAQAATALAFALAVANGPEALALAAAR